MMESINLSQVLLWFAGFGAALLLSPLLGGIINKVKAFFAGRKGPRILQLYYDMAKLLKKGSIRSTTSGGLVGVFPLLNVTALLTAALLLPFAFAASPFSFEGDILLFLYLLGFGRVITTLGALDTGSSFEGMGASRELQFSVLAELAFLGIAAFLVIETKEYALSTMLTGTHAGLHILAEICAAFALFIVLLAESCRVPFDDPETHLELTMIHEAMVLDNGGPGLAFIHYGASLKLWMLSTFLVSMLLPGCTAYASPWIGLILQIAVIFCVAVLIGILESTTARYRFLKVPQMLLAAFAFSAAALLLLIFQGVK